MVQASKDFILKTLLNRDESIMLSKTCSCCEQSYEMELSTCPHCGIQDLSSMDWIPDEVKDQFVKSRKPINLISELNEIQNQAKEASNQCNFKPNSILVKSMDTGLLDTIVNPDDLQNVIIYCNPKCLRCYTKEEILVLLRQQILFVKTYSEGAPFTPIEGIHQQQIDYRLGLKLAFDTFITYKEYVKLFPNDKNFHSAKRFSLTSFSLEYHTTKYQTSFPDSPFLQPMISILDMYQDASLFFFENESKLTKWIKKNSFDALYKIWKWFHEDFTFINKYTSERGETEKLLQLTEFASSSIYGTDIFTSNKISFLESVNQNLQLCEEQTTNPIGKSLIKSWRSRAHDSEIYQRR